MTKKFLTVLAIICVSGFFASYGYAQSMDETVNLLKEKLDIQWINKSKDIQQSQHISISHCQLTIEQESTMKNGMVLMQRIVVSVNKLDADRFFADKAQFNDEYFSVSLYCKGDEKNMEATSFVNGVQDGDPVKVNFIQVYSKGTTKTEKDTVINAFKRLGELCQ